MDLSVGQRERFSKGGTKTSAISSAVSCNTGMRVAEVRKFFDLDDTWPSLVKAAMGQLQLSVRAYHRIWKLSRTVANFAGCENIGPAQLAEALQYRPRGMMVG